MDYDVFDLGSVALTGGMTLPDAKLAYKTYGELNADRTNAIVYPTWYSGRHWDNEWLIGEGRGLDPSRYFIIVPNMLGNGLSSSPSNTPAPFDRARFPDIAVRDNVAVQHRLVTEQFGIERLALVLGWSMGAGQTFQWAVSHPEMVPRMLPFCGSARTSRHNKVFLEGVKARAHRRRRLPGGLVHRAPHARPPRRGPGLRGMGLLPGLLLGRGLPGDGLRLPGGLPRRLLGGLLPRRPRRQQPAVHAADLADRRRRQHAGLRRRHGRGAGVDHRARHRDAGREGPLLPSRGRGVGGVPHARRRAAGDPGHLGALRRGW